MADAELIDKITKVYRVLGNVFIPDVLTPEEKLAVLRSHKNTSFEILKDLSDTSNLPCSLVLNSEVETLLQGTDDDKHVTAQLIHKDPSDTSDIPGILDLPKLNRSTFTLLLHKNGTLNGLIKTWDAASQKLVASQEYKDGLRNGVHREYYYDDNFIKQNLDSPFAGNLAKEFCYSNDLKQGVSKEYHFNGKPKCQQTWNNGKLYGKATEWNAEGVITFDGNYNSGGKLDGTVATLEFRSEPVIVLTEYVDGILHGLQRYFSEGSAYPYLEKRFVNGECVELRDYYPGTNKVHLWNFFKNGKLNGLSRTFYENGILKHEYEYNDGKKVDMRREYHENGKLCLEITTLPNGNTCTKNYNERGNLILSYETRNGFSHGPMRIFQDNGQPLSEDWYENGQKHGICKLWLKSDDYDPASGKIVREVKGVTRGIRNLLGMKTKKISDPECFVSEYIKGKLVKRSFL